jgi:cytochrome c-type biogenesis protein
MVQPHRRGHVIVFGLHFLGLFRIPFLTARPGWMPGTRAASRLGAFVLGLAFAFGWTPCNGPILSGILTLAAQGMPGDPRPLLMAIYALGLGLPFLLSALFIARAMGLMKRLKPPYAQDRGGHGPAWSAVMLSAFSMVSGGTGHWTLRHFSCWLLEGFSTALDGSSLPG